MIHGIRLLVGLLIMICIASIVFGLGIIVYVFLINPFVAIIPLVILLCAYVIGMVATDVREANIGGDKDER